VFIATPLRSSKLHRRQTEGVITLWDQGEVLSCVISSLRRVLFFQNFVVSVNGRPRTGKIYLVS
jgi:hypothetical protein